MTADQFRQWTDRPENDGRRWELIRGVPTEMAQWPTAFDTIRMRIVGLLQDYVIRTGHGSVGFLGDGLITARDPDTVRRPAVMVFLGPPTDEFPLRFTTEVPSLAVELWPSEESHSRQFRRVREYVVEFGVPLVWSIYPEERCVFEYVPKRHPHVLDESDELTGNGVLPEFSCRVADLFAMPGQPPAPAPNPPTS